MKKNILMSVLLLLISAVNAAPPVTSGLVMHLEADSLGLGDGASVATWTDLSTAGNDATQTTGTAQPTYVASNAAFNDLATVSFDGTDDYMNLDGSIVTVDKFTLFIVGNFDTINDGGQHYFISAQGGSGDDRLRVAHYSWGSGFMTRIGNTGDANLGPINTSAAVIAVTGTADAWLNGGAKQIVGTNTSTLNPSDFALGCYNDQVGAGPRDFLDGDIAEVILYDRVLSDNEVTDTNKYLTLKYKPVPTASYPSPTGDDVEITATLSWEAPGTYENATYNVYFGTTEPNLLLPAPYGLTQIGTAGQTATTATPVPSPMAYDTPYWWVVDAYEPNAVPILHQGDPWSFRTEPSDNVPVVTAGSDWITWLDSGTVTQAVSGVINDFLEGDVADADIVWTIQAYPGGRPATCMQMIDRGGDDPLPAGETDDALLRDWIGTDTRGANIAGDPMTLTISGLASGTYTLTTIHHDLGDQTGKFDIAIDGSPVATDVDITSGTESPITRHVETITSDGSTPIKVVFDVNEPVDPNDSISFFVMNGLEIEDASLNVVKIDFGNNAANTSSAYEGYIAAHESPDTFGPAYYALGSGYVSISPIWGQASTFASVTKTNTGLSSTADFTTTQTGTYFLRLTAADDTTGGNPIPQVDWDILAVQVVDDACAAAQLDTANWTGFLTGDINEDCSVDLEDAADLAAEWLLKNEAGGSIEL